MLCPLFPVGVLGDGNRDGFKQLRRRIRYDHVLQDMVAEVGEKFGRRFERFGLFGYSGGGQFVNYALLHPETLWAVSIGAPGSVTLLDPEQDWWVGAMRRRALRQVRRRERCAWRVHDRGQGRPGDLGDHAREAASPHGRELGRRTRPERLESLRRSFEAAGVHAVLDLVDNVPHDGLKCVPQVQDFLAATLRRLRNE